MLTEMKPVRWQLEQFCRLRARHGYQLVKEVGGRRLGRRRRERLHHPPRTSTSSAIMWTCPSSSQVSSMGPNSGLVGLRVILR